jgi:hypothetical protein
MNISITNSMVFQKDEKHINEMFMKEKAARANYSQRIRDKKETKDDFYNDKGEQKKT